MNQLDHWFEILSSDYDSKFQDRHLSTMVLTTSYGQIIIHWIIHHGAVSRIETLRTTGDKSKNINSTNTLE